MSKMILALVITLLVLSNPVLASFSSTSCSNASGKIRYDYFMAWNTPESATWTINGTVLEATKVTREALTPQTTLEEWNDQMTGGRFYSEKIRVTLEISGIKQVFEDWVLCRAAGGI